MKSLRTLFLAIPLLTLVGCGCTGDEGTTTTPTPEVINNFRLGTKVLPFKATVVAKTRIDVFFLLDDSGYDPNTPGNPTNKKGMVYGDIVLQPGRKKQATGQAIFSDVVANLKADLAAQFPNDTFDIAYGVGRFEDFGGPFRADDKQARPFILNQPIYREDRLQFGTKFNLALTRNAPGSGNDKAGAEDPQSIVEALYQIGAGTGFDGDGGGTTGSGTFGSSTSQDSPGISGDVPAASFGADGNDEDGEPQFTTPGGLLSSGNLGGVGWRPQALHYVITTSDIAGVSPTIGDGLVTVPPAPTPISGVIRSSTGANAYPRTTADVPVQAFASVTGDQTVQANGRMGLRPAPVAPANAHTIQESVAALNATGLDIEVLSIGTPRSAPIPFKPNQPAPVVFPDIAAIPSPANPDFSPFTWMSAYALLTGAKTATNLPLVYNLSTVFPQNGAVLNHVREDLVYRIGQGKSVVAANNAAPAPVLYTFTPNINVGVGSPFQILGVSPIDTDGAGAQVNVVGNSITVLVQGYRDGIDPVPATVEIYWIVQLGLLDPFRATTANDNLPFSILAAGAGPARGPHNGTVFYTAPLPNGGVPTGSATLANVSAGCAFVAAQPGGGNRTDLGTCPQ